MTGPIRAAEPSPGPALTAQASVAVITPMPYVVRKSPTVKPVATSSHTSCITVEDGWCPDVWSTTRAGLVDHTATANVPLWLSTPSHQKAFPVFVGAVRSPTSAGISRSTRMRSPRPIERQRRDQPPPGGAHYWKPRAGKGRKGRATTAGRPRCGCRNETWRWWRCRRCSPLGNAHHGPDRASQTTKNTLPTPRFFRSVSTANQNFAPSPPVPTLKPRTSFSPANETPIAA